MDDPRLSQKLESEIAVAKTAADAIATAIRDIPPRAALTAFASAFAHAYETVFAPLGFQLDAFCAVCKNAAADFSALAARQRETDAERKE